MGRPLLNHNGMGVNKENDRGHVGGTIRVNIAPPAALMKKLSTPVDESFLRTGAEKKLNILTI